MSNHTDDFIKGIKDKCSFDNNLSDEQLLDIYSDKKLMEMGVLCVSCFFENNSIQIDKCMYEELVKSSIPQPISHMIRLFRLLGLISNEEIKNNLLIFHIKDDTINNELTRIKESLESKEDETLSKIDYIKDTLCAREEITKLRGELNTLVKEME